MSVVLVVFRPENKSAVPISVDEWRNLVHKHNDLRLRTEPFSVVNPKSGASITIPVGEADSEIHDQGEWIPFLRYSEGNLITKYQLEFEDPQNPIRIKLAAVAKILGAVISTDSGDEFLAW